MWRWVAGGGGGRAVVAGDGIALGLVFGYDLDLFHVLWAGAKVPLVKRHAFRRIRLLSSHICIRHNEPTSIKIIPC